MPRPTLGLSMIVKNGAETLRHCLKSVQGLADEIIVVDTGSTDNSQQIAYEFGATCASIPWQNDFAQARNAALDLSTTDWILWLDADEELDSEAKREISNLLRAAKPGIGGFIAPIRNYLAARHGSVNGNRAKENDGRCPNAKNAPAYAEHEVVRLFRRQSKIRFKGCVHEAIAPQIISAGFKLTRASFCIHHLGFLATERYRDKADFYLTLLRKKVEQQPNNPLAWLELARQLHEPFRKYEESLQCLDRAFKLDPKLSAARLVAGAVNLDLGRDQDALASLNLCSDEFAAERDHSRGDAFHNLGMLKEAQAAYSNSLRLIGHDPQLESKLGYVEVKLGNLASGFARLQNALAALPLGAELHERLIKAYLAAGMLPEAANAAENFATTLVHPKTILRAAAFRAHLKQNDQARSIISRGLKFFPESPELKSAQAELARI